MALANNGHMSGWPSIKISANCHPFVLGSAASIYCNLGYVICVYVTSATTPALTR